MAKPTTPGEPGTMAAIRVTTRNAQHAKIRGRQLLRRGSRGMTLIELMVVLAVIAILLSIAIPTYSRSILAAREKALRSDLANLREAIWRYTFDKQKAPQSLDDLKTAHYLEKIPDDPMTHEPNWEVVEDEYLLSPDQQDPGISDVHSASNAIGADGTAYSTW